MRNLTLILLLFIVSGGLLSCGSGPDQSEMAGVQDIVIVGGDTLGRNWDNLATEEDAQKARELGITPEQYLQLKDQEQQRIWQEAQAANSVLGIDETRTEEFNYDEFYDFEPTTFSDKMHKEQTYTVESQDGREIVVSSQDQGPAPGN